MAQTAHPGALLNGAPPAHRIWVGGPVPPGADAWTLGSLVIVRRGHEDSIHLMRHEAEHVRQYAAMGLIPFLTRYLADYLRLRLRGHGHDAAYRRLPAEIQAEWRTRRALGIGCTASEPTGAMPTAGDRDMRSPDMALDMPTNPV